jgi:hypothetical protein
VSGKNEEYSVEALVGIQLLVGTLGYCSFTVEVLTKNFHAGALHKR